VSLADLEHNSNEHVQTPPGSDCLGCKSKEATYPRAPAPPGDDRHASG